MAGAAEGCLLLQGFPLQKIAKYATNRGFTDLMVFNEDRKSVNGLLLIHLPEGPTAHFKLSNLVLSKDIKVNFLISRNTSGFTGLSKLQRAFLGMYKLAV